ncbi:MAG TPA: heavy metal translocating P-type ATPase [Mycobacterium sp.]|nr:heavy metal translocating P-type ATPase [Mycobacterium sp.]
MTAKLELEVSTLLPDGHEDGDGCLGRLSEALARTPGIDEAHIVTEDQGPAQLCLHYDRDALTVSTLRELAFRAGAAITDRYGHVVWQASGLKRPRRAARITAELERVAGVLEARAWSDGPLRIEFDREQINEDELAARLAALGVQVKTEPAVAGQPVAPAAAPAADHRPGAAQGEDHDHGGPFGEKSELVFALACGVFLAVGFALSFVSAVPQSVSLIFYVLSYGAGGYFTAREAIESIRARRFEIDFLMLVAALGAAALGDFAEGALLLFLFGIGHALEGYAMGRARRAIESLADIAPKTALVRRGADVTEVPVAELAVGDVVTVRPNSRIPADGFVIAGSSSVDQAPVTGESVPVDKSPVADRDQAAANLDGLGAENRVFAGTVNGQGALDIVVARLAADSTMSRVVRLISEAETQISPTQRFTKKFERIFVPLVLALVAALLLAPLVTHEPFAESFYRAMAVLVAASPCALAIATPSAVLAAVARAGNAGVLVKGGGPLENLGGLTAIAFDKTGTLTTGQPRIVDVLPAPGVEDTELLQVAVAVEQLSDHPLASAVARDGRTRLNRDTPLQATGLEALSGRGVRAMVEAEEVYIGKPGLFSEVGGPTMPAELMADIQAAQMRGRTIMVVRRGARYLGAIGLMDTPRDSARTIAASLRDLGIRRLIMISGDNQQVADAIAAQTGIDEAWGDLLPEDKVEAIRRLREGEHRVAMVGDGVNDAPAMANATVGIGMGAAGSDVALETADIALMADNLNALPFAVGLSRNTRRIIRQNLLASLGVVALLIPATILGLSIGLAVLVHEGSTLVVVANALRLLRYPLPKAEVE